MLQNVQHVLLFVYETVRNKESMSFEVFMLHSIVVFSSSGVTFIFYFHIPVIDHLGPHCCHDQGQSKASDSLIQWWRSSELACMHLLIGSNIHFFTDFEVNFHMNESLATLDDWRNRRH